MRGAENRFLRDIKLLMGIGAGIALTILGGGYFALRGLRWEETGELLRELVFYAAIGAALLVVVSFWVWRVARRLKRRPPPGDPT